MQNRKSIAIIGAGIAGISAARRLHDAGHRVVVFEKSRGFGGRCATKRWNGHLVDHGAQYFTIRSPEFRLALEAACGPSLLALEAPIVDAQADRFIDEPCFYHRSGNSRIARDLASGLEVRLEQQLTPLVRTRTEWQIGTETFHHVVSTAPWPQTLALAGMDPGPPVYHPCLTVILRYEGPPAGKSQNTYAISIPDDAVLPWTACENHKVGRVNGDHTVLVAQASPAFSREYYDADPAVWSADLRALAEERWECHNGQPADQFTHRWRYARVANPPRSIELPEGWHYAGDALSRSRLENSWISGRETARALLPDPTG
jgi:renalase